MKTQKQRLFSVAALLLASTLCMTLPSQSKADDAPDTELLLHTKIFQIQKDGEKKLVKTAVHALEFDNVERLYDKDLGILVSYFWDKKEELVITVDTRTYTDMFVLEPKISLEEILYAKEKGVNLKPPIEPKTKETKKTWITASSGIKIVPAKTHVDLTKEKEQNITIDNIVVREFMQPSVSYEIQVKVIQVK